MRSSLPDKWVVGLRVCTGDERREVAVDSASESASAACWSLRGSSSEKVRLRGIVEVSARAEALEGRA